MTDELVQRHVEQLRLTGGDLADLCQPLADAIEYLIAERDHAWEMVAKADTQVGQALADRLQDKAQIDRLRKMVQASVSFMNGDLTAEEWIEGCMRPWKPPALKGETP